MAHPRKLRFGLWYDCRNPSRWRQDPPALYAAVLDQIVRAERLGWDDVWLSEHHFVEDGPTPAVLPLAAAIAARTTRIRIGTSVLLLPLHDPVRLAEDTATLDIVSDGRVELGVAAGYRPAEFEGFGVPLSERASRMDEAVPILRRLLAGERINCEGRHYRYRGVELQPRPVQERLPIWIGGFSKRAARRAARLGDGYIVTGPVRPLIELCRRELLRLERDPERFEFAAGYPWLLVARDPERRWQEAREHLLYQAKLCSTWFAGVGGSLRPTARADADLGTSGVLIVTPEQAVERIEHYVQESGIQRFYGWTLPPGLEPAWSDEHLELMAQSVMPALRGPAGPTPPRLARAAS